MGVMHVSRDDLYSAYQIIMERWPSTIEPGEKTFHIDGGCNMRTLNLVHRKIEDDLMQEEFAAPTNEIIHSLEWSIFQTIHAALKNLTSMSKSQLDFEAVASRFDSLADYKVIDHAPNN